MKNGQYVLIRAPGDYPGKTYRKEKRYAYEHHVVWWLHTNEVISEDDVIHHINEDKCDNRFENLEKTTRSKHTSKHNMVEYVTVICGWCKEVFKLRPSKYRTRKKYRDKLFCSRSCGAKHQWNSIPP